MNFNQLKADVQNRLWLGDIPEALDTLIQSGVSAGTAKRLKSKWVSAKQDRVKNAITSGDFNRIENQITEEIQKIIDTLGRPKTIEVNFQLSGISRYAKRIGIFAAVVAFVVLIRNVDLSFPASSASPGKPQSTELAPTGDPNIPAPVETAATTGIVAKTAPESRTKEAATEKNAGRAFSETVANFERNGNSSAVTPAGEKKDLRPGEFRAPVPVSILQGFYPAPSSQPVGEAKSFAPVETTEAPRFSNSNPPSVQSEDNNKTNKRIYLNIGNDFKQASREGNFKIVTGDRNKTTPDIVFHNETDCDIDVEKIKRKIAENGEIFIWMSTATLQNLNNAAFASQIKSKWDIDISFDKKSKKGFLYN